MRKAFFILERNGFSHALRVLSAYFIEPAIMKVLPFYLIFYKRVRALNQDRDPDREIRYWRARKEELLKPAERGYRLKVEDLGLTEENLERLKNVGEKEG